uniref:SCP2 domain-containing protein n=1 Tax=Glossina pallidipes TaxID=7398 RepID=A0A1A9Z8A7_GLOPL
MQSDEIIEKIRNKLKESDPSKRTCMNIFQFNFTDAEGKLIKSMVFDFKELNIYEGTTESADTKIKVSDEDFFKIGCKQTTFDQLLAENKAQVEGDEGAFHQLLEKFRLNLKTE